jgi:hypothetical protein
MTKNATKNETPLITSATHADRGQQRFEQVRERRLTDPAQAQGGEGDAQLAGRQVGVELVVYGAQDAARASRAVGDGFDPGGAQLDHGELRRNEEAVEQHQDQSKRIMPKSANNEVRLIPGEGSMMEFCGFRVFKKKKRA